MAYPVTGIRINPEVKRAASAILEEKGETLSSFVNTCLSELVRSGGNFSAPMSVDYVEEYLKPIMDDRHLLNKANTSIPRLRRRLAARRAYIFGE